MMDGQRTGGGERAALVVVSNRGPYALTGSEGPEPDLQPTVGGLVSAVEPIIEQQGGTWVCWLGRTLPDDGPLAGGAAAHDPAQGEASLASPGGGYRLQEVRFSAADRGRYYDGLANGCLWPLAHAMAERARFEEADWAAYRRVNERFAARAVEEGTAGRLFWVHDFHLSLVPALLRQQYPMARVAFFWHIPFPPVELFAMLPWATEVLAGLLGSDRIGFHLPAYAGNFMRAVEALLGARVDPERGRITWEGRTVKVQALPVGVDTDALRGIAERAAVQERAAAVRREVGANRRLLLSIDRMDYTKGIPERLAAVESLLETWPGARGNVVFVQVAVPTRGDAPEYRALQDCVQAMAQRINHRFGNDAYQPVHLRLEPLPQEDVVAQYLAADVAVITPLRDGLNLVAKEYVSARGQSGGVLVLSQFAGAASQLPEALIVNPYHQEQVVAALRQAVEMPAHEQRHRMQAMHKHVAAHDRAWWWQQVEGSLLEDPVEVAAGAEQAGRGPEPDPAVPQATSVADASGWIDVSVTVSSGMVHWPDDPPVHIERAANMERGDSANVTRVSMGAHTGTHVDAPCHFVRGAAGIDTMPLSATMGPVRVIGIEDPVQVTVAELVEHDVCQGQRVLFKTHNSRGDWQAEAFREDFVYISAPAGRYLAGCGVQTVGIDYVSVGGYEADAAEVHQALLEAGVWIIEGLNLAGVEPGWYDLICLPLKIEAGDGAPARALLRPLREG